VKVLIIGSGGREHALTWVCRKSPLAPEITCAPGNGGTSKIARNVDISVEDIDRLEEFAVVERFDLTIIGPEAPSVAGLADRLTARGLRVFGPSAEAAKIEGSKAFAKSLMVEAGVPTAAYEIFSDSASAVSYIKSLGAPIVVKASGLAAGKGAVVCMSLDGAVAAVHEMMDDAAFGSAGATVVVEEYLEGREVSMTAIVDGTDYLMLPPSRDHKRVGDGDTGLNTGGMGAYSPLEDVSDEQYQSFAEAILPPILKALADRGTPFRGTLYPGLMVKDGKFKVLEFNARFGDPETQVLLPLLSEDLLEIIFETASGGLAKWMSRRHVASHDWRRICRTGHAVTIVAAAKGYPGAVHKGAAIIGLPFDEESRVVFHAGTKTVGDLVVTSGGRVLAVTGLGATLHEAAKTAYDGIESIDFDGMHYRHDIGSSMVDR